MNKINLISILIPAYNYGHYLEETLQSVLTQSIPNWECIIIDDGSTDSTKEIALKYQNNDNRFRYFYQINQGLSSARNTGINNAKGEYLQFLDADDLIEPEKLEKQFDFLKKNKIYDLVVGPFKYFYKQSGNLFFKEWSSLSEMELNNINTINKALLIKNLFPVSAPLIRKQIFDKSFRFDTSLTSMEDWDLWLNIIQSSKFYFLNILNTGTLIRSHNESMSTDNWRMEYNQLKVRLKLRQSLLDKQSKNINQKGIESCIKTMMYRIADEFSNKNSYKGHEFLLQLDKIYPNYKIKLLKNNWMHQFPYLFRKLAWLLFEKIDNIIKQR